MKVFLLSLFSLVTVSLPALTYANNCGENLPAEALKVSADKWTHITFEQMEELIRANQLEGLRLAFYQTDTEGRFVYDGKYNGLVWKAPEQYPNDRGGRGLYVIPILLQDNSKIAFEFSPYWQANGPFFMKNIKVRKPEK